MENLGYGFSPLHAWIKMLELVLHVCYKGEWKKPTTAGASTAERARMKEIKQELQMKFRTEMGIRVDEVIAGQIGTSNTGNVARRFFSDPEKAAEITGFDEQLIRRFQTILILLQTHKHVDLEAFDA